MCFKNKLFLLIVFFFMLVLFLPIFFIPENLGGGKRGKSVCQSTTLILVLNTFESCQWLYQTSLCVLLCGKLSFVFSVNHQWERVQSITLGVLGTLDSKRLGYSTLEWKQESTKVAWRVSRTVRCLCMWHVEVCLWLCDRLETLLFLLTVPCYASWPRRHIAPRPYRSAHLGGAVAFPSSCDIYREWWTWKPCGNADWYFPTWQTFIQDITCFTSDGTLWSSRIVVILPKCKDGQRFLEVGNVLTVIFMLPNSCEKS